MKKFAKNQIQHCAPQKTGYTFSIATKTEP